MFSQNFNVHLPSNTRVFDNKTNKFIVRLPKKLDFRSQWLVGLSVINYPKSWHNIGGLSPQYIIINTASKIYKIDLPQRTVNKPELLVEILNNSLIHVDKDWEVLFSYNKNTGCIELGFSELIKSVELSDQLSHVLGFPGRILTDAKSKARFEPDLSGGIALLYVYAPGLIAPVTIGDITAPLLRVVNVKGEHNQLVEQIYDNVQFHELLAKEISEISIEIRTPSGEFVPFQHGSCFLTLTFRKAPLL